LALIARLRPTVETIRTADVVNVVRELVHTRKCATLTFNEAIGVAGPGYFSFSPPNYGIGLISILIDVQAIFSRAIHIESQIRSINFERIIARVAADAEGHRTNRQTKLRNVITQIKKSNAGFWAKANRRGSQLNISARIAVHPQVIANRQRTVRHGLQPIAHTTRLK
jgi:hypothetical protein